MSNPTYVIHSFELGPMDNLIHILVDQSSKKATIFDPGYEADFLLDFIHKNQLTLDKIIFTHAHYDHISALNDILEAHPVPVYISKAEHDFYNKAIPNLHYVEDQDEFTVGDTTLTAISTSGHSAGSICYQMSHDIIMGDTIFIYGCGHCKLPGANPETLFDSLQKLKQTLDPSLIVHSSHTYGITNTSTWQEQLDGNPFLHFTDKNAFVKYREHTHDQIRTYPMQAISKIEMHDYL